MSDTAECSVSLVLKSGRAPRDPGCEHEDGDDDGGKDENTPEDLHHDLAERLGLGFRVSLGSHFLTPLAVNKAWVMLLTLKAKPKKQAKGAGLKALENHRAAYGH